MAMRVLIVDDHAGFRASARRLLEAEGLEVVGEAADGAEAETAISELVPDLVLLDCQLPDVDGRELAGTIDGPMVLLTSSRDDIDCTDCDCIGFIAKDQLSAAAIAALTG